MMRDEAIRTWMGRTNDNPRRCGEVIDGLVDLGLLNLEARASSFTNSSIYQALAYAKIEVSCETTFVAAVTDNGVQQIMQLLKAAGLEIVEKKA